MYIYIGIGNLQMLLDSGLLKKKKKKKDIKIALSLGYPSSYNKRCNMFL